MEVLFAISIGVVTSCGVFMVLQRRSFSMVLGLSLLSYAVNLFLFSVGRLTVGAAPIQAKQPQVYADPIPQALVLTAIVIGLAMTAFVVVLALRARASLGTDDVNGREDGVRP